MGGLCLRKAICQVVVREVNEYGEDYGNINGKC